MALVIGCLLIVPALGMLLGGAALGLGYAFGRDDGFFQATLDRVSTPTVAVTAEDLRFGAEPGSPARILDALDADVRLRVTGAEGDRDLFVGIARERDLDAYLAGVAHDEIVDVDGQSPDYRRRDGVATVEPPGEQGFWTQSSSGAGTQELVWEAEGGRWAAVVMNADGSPGVDADVTVGIRAPFVLPLAFTLLGLGAALSALAVVLIVAGATGDRSKDGASGPGVVGAGQPGEGGVQGLTGSPAQPVAGDARPAYPVTLSAALDPQLSRWMWLVKWFLAIPHFVVLVFLWLAFAVLTVVAGVAILFTGRYPRALFDFNVGVMRWSWRVQHYATSGGLGTDRYPPFSLADDPTYPAHLDVAYPTRLSRGLVLVKWWLLAIPHYVIVGVLVGGSIGWRADEAGDARFDLTGGGLLGLLVLIAGVILLVNGRYPRALYDLVVGLNRWVYRVMAYAALMTDRYPPFRLDQGGADPNDAAGYDVPVPPGDGGSGAVAPASSVGGPAPGVEASSRP
ncbi:MAG: DUF4389 domain-containing protein [Acidimicrobiia bacterium]|nr:DUF4389 domain-containing protein [Acidimicrobiia bacterium]